MNSSVRAVLSLAAMLFVSSCATNTVPNTVPDSALYFDSKFDSRCIQGTKCAWFGEVAYTLSGQVNPLGLENPMLVANLAFASDGNCFIIPISAELYVELDNVFSRRLTNEFRRTQLAFKGEAYNPERLEIVEKMSQRSDGPFVRTPSGDIVDVGQCDGVGPPTVLDPTIKFERSLIALN